MVWATLKMEAAGCVKLPVPIYNPTYHDIPENCSPLLFPVPVFRSEKVYFQVTLGYLQQFRKLN
jgi:hypothetical protein